MSKLAQKNSFWESQRVLVTGGSDFLGSFVVDKLITLKAQQVSHNQEFDLREASHVKRLLIRTSPTLIIHLAAASNHNHTNQEQLNRFLYDNALAELQLMEYAQRNQVQKVVLVGSVNTYLDEKIASSRFAEKMSLTHAQAFHEMHGLNVIHLRLANLYGPRDKADFKASQGIPTLIGKLLNSKSKKLSQIEISGTGGTSQEYLYVEDAADAILLAAENYNRIAPVNVGTGKAISTRFLVNLLKRLTEYRGRIAWINSKSGVPSYKPLDITRARKEFGFRPKMSLEQGLHKTINWCKFQEPHQKAESPEIVPPENSKIERFTHPTSGETIAIVVREGFTGDKYNFFTANESPLQAGLNFYKAGEKIQAHVHIPQTKTIRQMLECLFIKKGKVLMHLFDESHRHLSTVDLYAGDLVIQIVGGHGFEIIHDTEILEIKQGPYGGPADKIQFSFDPVKACH